MIGQTISHYRILEKLGEGGMGVVYKAEDIKLDRLVALKFLSPFFTGDASGRERFYHEARAAAALTHQNIAVVHEIGEHDDRLFIAMEYVEGKTLTELVESEMLPIRKVLDIAIQVCEGLAAAHEKGIVHRDIKPANIVVTAKGQAKIMDFGLAKVKGTEKLTQAGSTLGTAAYMSPEQAVGEEVDHRSDIFSFGVVLYELLAGRLPFQAEHRTALLYCIVNEEPQPIARFNNQVSPELQRIVTKALVKNKEERYQHIDDCMADLRHEKKSLDSFEPGRVPKEDIARKSKRKVLPLVIPASVVALLIALFLIFKPFKLEIAPEQDALAKENSLAIMYFENMTDPEDTDRIAQMITALLTTGLSETPQYMQVVSSQRLYDILKLLGKEHLKVIDKTVASEVARRAGVKWILTGKLLQTKPTIVLISEISEATTGRILATQRVSGTTSDDLFTVVDELSPQVAKALSLPEQAKQELDKPLADVTTRSQEAYRYYLEGIDYGARYYYAEAMTCFRKALEFDSTFAMAYGLLAWFAGPEDEARRLVAEAVKYSDRASLKEKLYIKSLDAQVSGDYGKAVEELQTLVERFPDEKEAYYKMGWLCDVKLKKPEEAIHHYEKAVEIDPLFKMAYNQLAYEYNRIGDLEKSLFAINKYISIAAPNEANPYDTRADLYAFNGKLDQAIDSYNKALEVKPDFFMSRYKLGGMYLFKKDYDRAERCFKDLSSSDDKYYRSQGRLCLAFIPLYQGRLDDALTVLDNGIAADNMEQVEQPTNADKHFFKGAIYGEKKEWDSALNEVKIGIDICKKVAPSDPVCGRDFLAAILARSGKMAEAGELARALKDDIEQRDPTVMYAYFWVMGEIEKARGNLKAAIGYFEKAETDTAPSYTGTQTMHMSYVLAETYLQAGRLDEAVAQLEKALSRYEVERLGFAWVKAYYLLGSAYEKSGWNKRAIEKYEEFLDFWKDADAGIPEVADARERVRKLQASGGQ